MASVDLWRYKRLVQALWDPEPKNDDPPGSSMWCLGREYNSQPPLNGARDQAPSTGHEMPALSNGLELQCDSQRMRDAAPSDGLKAEQDSFESTVDRGWPPRFLDDCESRIWFTYRSNFPAIKKSSDASMTLSVRLRSLGDQGGFTSDTGWGYWRRGSDQEEERRLLSMFADDPRAPFSIHRFVEHGASACGKHPGEWFGPSATARCIQALSHEHENNGLKVYVNGDGADVYQDELFRLAKGDGRTFNPTLVLVGIRLGIDRVTPAYWNALKASLQLPQCVGIAGGRPSSSHYFFGTQGDHFFYLDPHVTRPALRYHSNPADLTEEDVETCHTRRLRRLALIDMDPSMLLAFLIRDEKDWESWRRAISSVPGKPVVHVADKALSLHGQGDERQSAVDDVETFDDEDGVDEGDGELVERPRE